MKNSNPIFTTSGYEFEQLSNLRYLKSLHLECTQEGPCTFNNYPIDSYLYYLDLESLTLENIKLSTNQYNTLFRGLSSLKELKISTPYFTTSGYEFEQLPELRYLKSLHLTCTQEEPCTFNDYPIDSYFNYLDLEILILNNIRLNPNQYKIFN